MKYRKLNLLLILFSLHISCDKNSDKKNNDQDTIEKKVDKNDTYRIVGDKHFTDGYSPLSEDSLINVIIEIPTGTVEKWEVEKKTGELALEIRDGDYRKVNYLGYPGNYGMIPQTLSPLEDGGDGDPLDVLILGEPLERGSIVSAKLIGVLKLLDRGEEDDKLIAVVKGSPFYEINEFEELDVKFKGVTNIIEIWFNSYKGGDKVEILGFGNQSEAKQILNAAIQGYIIK